MQRQKRAGALPEGGRLSGLPGFWQAASGYPTIAVRGGQAPGTALLPLHPGPSPSPTKGTSLSRGSLLGVLTPRLQGRWPGGLSGLLLLRKWGAQHHWG